MSLFQDLKYTFRTICKQPVFTGVAIVTLALGLGANSAIFSVVYAVLLEPVAYPAEAPQRVLVLSETSHHWDEIGVSYPNFKDWQRQNRSFEKMAGFRDARYNLSGLEEPLRVRVRLVSHGYFDIMGVTPLFGRFFTPEEDEAGADEVVVLGHRLWQNRFGGAPDIVGESVRLSERPYTVIGVLPPDFDMDRRERAYIALEPWADNDGTRQRGNHQGMRVLGRLKDGVSFEESVAEMDAIAARLEAEYPDTNSTVGARVQRIADRRVQEYRATLWLLLGAVSLVLIVACVNVANLFLARSVSRRRDTAIRAALGASRRRLLQQGLTEGVVFALFGGALGVALAFAGLSLLRNVLPADVPRLQNVALDWQVLSYTLGLSLATAIVFGAVPALLGSRARPVEPLKAGGRSTGERGGAGRTLLVVEVALATMLLIGAALLIRSISELTRVDPGFQTDRLLTMEVGLPFARYDGDERTTFLRRMREELSRLPGVRSATVGLVLPMLGSNWSSIFIVSDQPVPPRAELPSSIFTPVTPGYFETFGIPLVRGRDLQESDDSDAPDVVVVNQTLAQRIWPNENPIGKSLKQGWPEDEGEFNPWREVIGVVGDVKQLGLDTETRMQVFIPIEQAPVWQVNIALRTEVDPLSLTEPVKTVIHSMDRDVPVYDVQTMEDVLATSIAPRRFTMVLLGIFAALALVLAAIGLYGVIAHSVAKRTQEIGVRMSVGAGRGNIFGLVVRQGMVLSVIGAAIGTAVAFFTTRVLGNLLYGVAARDPLSFSIVPLLLLVVAFVSCAAPALAATRVDPIRALRHE